MARAIRFHRYGGPEELRLDDVPVPEPGPGEVRLRVVAAGVNPVECRLRRGELAGGVPLDAPRGLGTDVAGVVDAVDTDAGGVGGFSPGDEVFGRALRDGYAEYAVAAPEDLVARPPELAWDVAASIAIPGETAYRTLGLLGVAAGTTLLVHGASGGVGFVAAQLAVMRGARVIGTSSAAHHERLRAAGVEPVAYGERWTERVRVLGPVDAVLDTAGRGMLPGSIALAGGPERVVTIADRRDATALGVTYSRGLVSRVPMAEVFAELLPALRDGHISVPIGVRLPLAEAAEAHRVSEAGHPGGRIVLTVADP